MTEQEMMMTSVLNCRRIDLYTRRQQISSVQQRVLKQMEKRLDAGEPLQYILGETEFGGLRFKVDPSVLIPRPETELMVEKISEIIAAHQHQARPFCLFDIGTGSGCIAITLAKRFFHLKGKAIDISADALEVASYNARQHGVSDQLQFYHQDIRSLVNKIPNAYYDMIVSNPPYIPTDKLSSLPHDVQCEPALALDGGKDGLDFYRILSQYALNVLRKGGWLVCEFWDGQAPAIQSIFGPSWHIEFFSDFLGEDRFFVGQYSSGNNVELEE